jgi:ankyrin repeat protein
VPDPTLPEQPNLEQYKKKAKDLLRLHAESALEAWERIERHHPRFRSQGRGMTVPFRLADAQLVIARECGFESWPKFARHLETLRLTRAVAALADPVSAFIEAASAPREAHNAGTVEEAEMILARYPHAGAASIHAAAILGNEAAVRDFLSRDPASATEKGGPRGWDALTHLCFSRYLRIERSRSEAFVGAARALLDAGASANTGWIETIEHPSPHPMRESAIYGAAGVAQHAGVTRLLIERGADPNDDETPYHVPETRDNTVLRILLDSGKLNQRSLGMILLRKCDWHDAEGVRLALAHGADPNQVTMWGHTALHQAVRRDNRLEIIEALVEAGADPALENREGRSAILIAAHRGRADVLALFERRGTPLGLTGAAALIAACARDQPEVILAADSQAKSVVRAHGGTLLGQFAGVGNVAGVRHLLDLDVSADARDFHGDGYFGIAKMSTALHVAAWRAWPEVVKELLARGAPVNAIDGQGRTALQLAVKACVDSYWMERRSPDSVRALLEAGAVKDGIDLPTGYEEIDHLLRAMGPTTPPIAAR